MRYFLTFMAGMVTVILLTVIFRPYFTPDPIIKTETRVVIDTVRDTLLVERDRYIVRSDTIHFVQTVDSLITDTLYIPIPIERVEYRTPEYFAVVEGYKPRLAEIETYGKTVYIDRVETLKTKPKWGVGLQAGYGATHGGIYPYIGFGLTYNLITW